MRHGARVGARLAACVCACRGLTRRCIIAGAHRPLWRSLLPPANAAPAEAAATQHACGHRARASASQPQPQSCSSITRGLRRRRQNAHRAPPAPLAPYASCTASRQATCARTHAPSDAAVPSAVGAALLRSRCTSPAPHHARNTAPHGLERTHARRDRRIGRRAREPPCGPGERRGRGCVTEPTGGGRTNRRRSSGSDEARSGNRSGAEACA